MSHEFLNKNKEAERPERKRNLQFHHSKVQKKFTLNQQREVVWTNARSRLSEKAKKLNVEECAILKDHTKCADAKCTRNPSHQ